mmetsp:Transcript_247/g.975  ORF Transcript_247/g.975 Transcript_247/m.975 type:complete len:268 (+) Transcript_247:977-1780(+)
MRRLPCHHELSEEWLSNIFSMSLILKGLAIQCVKPWTKHFSLVSAKASAVTATILELILSPYLSLSSFTTSIPPFLGMCRSMKITSKAFGPPLDSICSNAMTPSSAVVIFAKPRRVRIPRHTFMLMTLSSAIKILHFSSWTACGLPISFFTSHFTTLFMASSLLVLQSSSRALFSLPCLTGLCTQRWGRVPKSFSSGVFRFFEVSPMPLISSAAGHTMKAMEMSLFCSTSAFIRPLQSLSMMTKSRRMLFIVLPLGLPDEDPDGHTR